MSVGTRAATCSSCGKRLNRKSWYYRNGKYYCKRHCWVTEQEKATKEAASAGAAKAEAKTEPTKPASKEEGKKEDAKKEAQASA